MIISVTPKIQPKKNKSGEESSMQRDEYTWDISTLIAGKRDESYDDEFIEEEWRFVEDEEDFDDDDDDLDDDDPDMRKSSQLTWYVDEDDSDDDEDDELNWEEVDEDEEEDDDPEYFDDGDPDSF